MNTTLISFGATCPQRPIVNFMTPEIKELCAHCHTNPVTRLHKKTLLQMQPQIFCCA